MIADGLLARNAVSDALFARESDRLAVACSEMSARFLRGGRLLAFGSGASATDAQHVSVEFVHPVIVGKRALPALDLSIAFAEWAPAICKPDDIAMGFAPPSGDPAVRGTLAKLREIGAQTFALSGDDADFTLDSPSADPFISQEIIEILYHTLWETVHVFFEHNEQGHDVGSAGFLYPFLGREKQDTRAVLQSVADSIRIKAADVAHLREQVAGSQSERIAAAARAISDAVRGGGKLILLGNGGSATDANDLALDCVAPPKGYRPVPAVSLAMEPANISAIANDIGSDAIFLRQLIAQAAPHDVVVALSTSGGSASIISALTEARKRRMPTVALLGYDGGEIVRRGLADFPVVVTSDYIPRIQEVQASVYHVMRDMLEVLVNE
ncbi:MAG: SIS domain-containing protein [Gemmatimonadaceae bacterium]|nr:SIS domain-containing protein [Gemmatimonadaceae bacterium]